MQKAIICPNTGIKPVVQPMPELKVNIEHGNPIHPRVQLGEASDRPLVNFVITQVRNEINKFYCKDLIHSPDKVGQVGHFPLPATLVIGSIDEIVTLNSLCAQDQFSEIQRLILQNVAKLDCQAFQVYNEGVNVIQELFSQEQYFPQLCALELGHISWSLTLSNLARLTKLTVGDLKFSFDLRNPGSGHLILTNLPNLETLTTGDIVTLDTLPKVGELEFSNLPRLTTVSLGMIYGPKMNFLTIPQLQTLEINGILNRLELSNIVLTTLTIRSGRQNIWPSELVLLPTFNPTNFIFEAEETDLHLWNEQLLNFISQGIRAQRDEKRDESGVKLLKRKAQPQVVKVNYVAARPPLKGDFEKK